MTTQTNTTLVEEAVERIKAEIAFQEENPRGICATVRLDDLRTLLASLPTDDGDTVERAYRKGWNTGFNASTAGWKNVEEVIDESWIIDREAIHTLIGRDR